MSEKPDKLAFARRCYELASERYHAAEREWAEAVQKWDEARACLEEAENETDITSEDKS